MRRKTLRLKALCLGVLAALGFTMANAKPIVHVTANITANTYWDSSNIYQLEAYIYVKNGATLTIQEGTLITGTKTPSLGALIITRGSKIEASGSLGHPIVFTSSKAPAARTRGDWGGLIILGKAHHNLGGAYIEGITPNADTWFGTTGTAGVTSAVDFDDHDNSGTLSYVRIEFGGYALSPNNEINGLTFGAVGDGTTVDHVQVSYANDDSYEWFGGTVNCKHLIAFRGIDDDFDTDNGYSGKCQFLVSLRDPNVADQSSSSGFESDNNADGTTATPITKAVFSNVTILGGGDTTNNALYIGVARIRRNADMFAINTIMQGFPQGLQIDGTRSHLNVKNDTLVMNSIITVKSGLAGNKYIINAGTVDEVTYPGLKNTVKDLLLSHAFNQFAAGNAFTQLTNPYNLNSPNFLPNVASPAVNASSWALGNYHAVLDDPFFDQVSFIGAFGPQAGIDDWTSGWANFNPTATDAPKPATTQNCSVAKYVPQITTTFVQPVCKTGKITAVASKGAAPTGTEYKYIWGRVYGTDTLFNDTTASGVKSALDSGTYAVKVQLGECYSITKVIALKRQVPKFAGYVATTNSLLVKLNLGNIYKYMSGYATLIRYKKSTDATWSIWSGNNNQNVYYYGTVPRDSLWRNHDTTKPGSPLITTDNVYMNPGSLTANLFTGLDANTTYNFQMKGRCFTDGGTVIFSDTIVTNPGNYRTARPLLMPELPSGPEESSLVAGKSEATVYPNPARSIVNVNTTGFNTNTLQIRVLNLNGAVVYNAKQAGLKQANTSINVANFASGNYMVEITDGVKKVTKQITVIK